MYKYYIKTKLNPTYMALESRDRFDDYFSRRCYLLQSRLNLPVKMFNELDVLEFGPGAGENALILALLGANMHLVEPVSDFHHNIKTYFEKYGALNRLKEVQCNTIQSFGSSAQYDFVVAEGFVDTSGPADKWISWLADCVRPGGFTLFTYYDLAGYLIELFQSRIIRISSALNNLSPVETAQIIIRAKWDRIYHTRTFESWVNDVVMNPFIHCDRAFRFIDIIDHMVDNGMMMYSSWPRLSYSPDMSWSKYVPSQQDYILTLKHEGLKLIPGLILGKYVEINNVNIDLLYELYNELETFLRSLDTLTVDNISSQLQIINNNIDSVVTVLNSVVKDFTGSELDLLFNEIKFCLDNCQSSPDKLSAMFLEDKVIGKYWGSPNMYMVFQK